jgi:hypothetical protein
MTANNQDFTLAGECSANPVPVMGVGSSALLGSVVWCGKTHDDMRQCCCDCRYHLPVHHHCCTTPKPDRKTHTGPCCCGVQKGWACVCPEAGRVYDNWPEHSCGCEMHTPVDALPNTVL